MTLFQTPTKMGKGVLVSPTVHGNLLLGPSAIDVEDGTAVETTAQALKLVSDAARKTWPGENLRGVITTFAGIRATLSSAQWKARPAPMRRWALKAPDSLPLRPLRRCW